MADTPPKGRAGSIKAGGVSAFTALLSKAANDPSLLESPVLAKNDKPVIVQQAPKKEDVITQKDQPAANEIATVQTRKEVPDSQKGLPASNAVAMNQTKKDGATTQKEKPVANPSDNEQVKKNVADAAKEQPVSNAVAINQTQKETANIPKDQASTPTNAADQAKKEVPDPKKGQPVTTSAPTDQTKKEVADDQKKQPASTDVAIDQAKKLDSSATANATRQNKNTTKTGEQEKKLDTAAATNTEKTDKSTAVVAAAEKQEPVKNPVTTTEVAKKSASPEKYKRSLVTKKSESSTTDGFGLVFIDQFSNDQKDTIEIFIPNPKEDVAKNNNQPPPTRKFLEIGNEEKSVAKASPISNKSCSAVATDKDFFNLRKKMAALETDDAMINESKKSFKSKCYTTEQIKNLGSLFLKESGKFQFYEAAFPFSSDQGNFVALQSDFKDNYFIYRFKKLVN
jgi:hypothetical protein